MFGAPIKAVASGVSTLMGALRQDPYALESAYLSVITFSNDANLAVPLTDLVSFQEPEIKAQGMTALGGALRLLSTRIKEEVQTGSADKKGDWKPLIFLMTDGAPNDDWEPAVEEFSTVPTAIVVACAVGEHADVSVLKRITENVIRIDNNDPEAFAAFFKWVSSSVSNTSKKVDLTKKDVDNKMDELPPPPPEVTVVL